MKELEDTITQVEGAAEAALARDLVLVKIIQCLCRALREALPGVYSADAMQGKNRAERVLRELRGLP